MQLLAYKQYSMKWKLLILVVLVAGLAGIFAFSYPADNNNQNSNQLFNNNNKYTKLWKSIDSLERKQLPQSAAKIAEEIYNKAKADDNQPQRIKALIYQLKYDYILLTQNEEQPAIFNKFEEEIAQAEPPVKNIIHSIQAEAYHQFFNQNRWRYYNRTQTVNFEKSDILTWSLDDILEKIVFEHQQALQNESLTQSNKIETYKDILHLADRKENENPRPTLYDFLANRAINFYQNDESSITKPAYAFELNGTQIFEPTLKFINENFETKDTLSNKYAAVKAFQALEKLHQNDADKLALIESTLRRLQFGLNNCRNSNKNELYKQAIENLIEKHQSDKAHTQASYQLAQYYFQNAYNENQFQSENVNNNRKKALEICEAAIQKFPNSFGAINCQSLKNQIEQKTILFKLENVNVPNQPFRALLNYKNINQVYAKVVKTSYKDENDNYENSKQKLKRLNKLPAIETWNFELPDPKDYNPHSLEFKVNALPTGYYYLMLSHNNQFKENGNAVAVQPFWVSNLSVVTQKANNSNQLHLFVVDRTNGAPIKSAKANVYFEDYNRNSRKRDWKFDQTYTTDDEGMITLSSNNKSRRIKVEVEKGNDQYVFNEYLNRGYGEGNRTDSERIHLFTDRSIYRPGQTVYYKGILINYTADNQFEISSNKSVNVELFDANYQQVSKQTKITNQYGSISGEFTLPEGGLGGVFRIQTEYGTQSISVEEYKRPRFEVEFDTIKGTYALNDKVEITGKATSFAGAAIDGAKVKYKVERVATYPYWYGYWSRRYMPPSQGSQIMEQGETTTDETGTYKIKFKAMPDLNIDEKYKPIFNYTVTATVVDNTGETHESKTYVRAGYVAIDVSMQVPEVIEKNEVNEITISTKNLNGNFEATDINVSIKRLIEPEQLLRKRYWAQPDQFIIEENQYRKDFPNDIYKDEDDFANWETDKTYKTVNDKTTKDYKVVLNDLKSWTPGKYQVKITAKDKNGTPVELIQYFDLLDADSKKFTSNKIIELLPIKQKATPGETASFIINTAADDLNVYYAVEHNKTFNPKEWIKLSKEQRRIDIPIEQKHIGNLVLHVFAVNKNRYFSYKETITVPYPSKELDIELITFRDKLQPNQKEQWKLKITGPKGEKVAAEMLAGMYDASLDQFKPHSWQLALNPSYYYSRYQHSGLGFEHGHSAVYQDNWNQYKNRKNRAYDQLNWFGFNMGGYYGFDSYTTRVQMDQVTVRGSRSEKILTKEASSRIESAPAPMAAQADMAMDSAEMNEEEMSNGNYNGGSGANRDNDEATQQAKQKKKFKNVSARSNLKETAFFFPQLETDKKGNILIAFDAPEALTTWKFLGLAHDTDLNIGQLEKEIITQKELMVTPNAPRFFREGDEITFTAKVNNLSNKILNGDAILELYDATTNETVDAKFSNGSANKTFNVAQGRSEAFEWTLNIPSDVDAVTYKVLAKAGKQSDGEQNAAPVLKNSMLVTETMPLPIRGGQSKTYTFDKLKNNSSSTLKHHQYTLEFTSNPAWYAVQALPYLMDYPHNCAEQIFSRLYANSLASHIANSQPKIQEVFEAWKNTNSDELVSNLEKNEELKNILLEETPWVMDAQSETERKKRIGLLFDLNKMSKEYKTDLDKLLEMQLSSGAFPWFNGMRENRYITQHIVNGLGKLDHLGVKEIRQDARLWSALKKAVDYLDREVRDDYKELKRRGAKMKDQHISNIHLHYFYTRSFFKDIPVNADSQTAYNYYSGQMEEYWTSFGYYQKGMISLSLHRMDKPTIPADIIKSLSEYMQDDEEMGNFFKYDRGYHWHQAPIETQALLIEAYDEITANQEIVDGLKVWLLKQKQTQDWKTTRATVEAVYALLRRGVNWLSDTELVEVSIANNQVQPAKDFDVLPETATGYYKVKWDSDEVTNEMSNVKVNNPNEQIAWGAVYWQYFEQLDKITFAETPLSIKKDLFKQISSDRGDKLSPLADGEKLTPGDKVIVRIEIRVDRAMDYVHMKDMRAAGFEPVNVLSQYKYQDGLGYYESTKDASTNFFFDRLNVGTYVFEYPLKVYHKGNFSNGITTIQCMYAPEFTSHSEGVRVVVE